MEREKGNGGGVLGVGGRQNQKERGFERVLAIH